MKQFWIACGMLLATLACSPKDDAGGNATGGSRASGGGGSGGASTGGTAGFNFGGQPPEPIPPRACKPPAEKPSFTLTGTICGNPVNYSGPEGTRVLISHAPLVKDINVFTFADTDFSSDSLSREFLKTHDVQFHVDTHDTTTLVVGKSTLTARMGEMNICGLGTAYVKEETPLEVSFESLEQKGNDGGRVRLRISNIIVDAADPVFGATELYRCSPEGELTAEFEGEYVRVL